MTLPQHRQEADQLRVWTVVARPGPTYVPGLAQLVRGLYNRDPLPKENARQLLLERVNGYAVPRYHDDGSWLFVWDLSEAQELRDFSRSVAEFRNLATGRSLHLAIIPAVLGGLSHDWIGIQLADFYSNVALNYRAEELNFTDADADKAQAFRTYLMPTLATDAFGNRVGWKTWN